MKSESGRTCTYVKKDGQRCRACALSASLYCFFHDPGKGRERRAARRAGGIARSHPVATLPADSPDRSLATVKDVIALLRDAVNQALRGELNPKTATAVGYLSGILIRALEHHELERQVVELEAIANEPSDVRL